MFLATLSIGHWVIIGLIILVLMLIFIAYCLVRSNYSEASDVGVGYKITPKSNCSPESFKSLHYILSHLQSVVVFSEDEKHIIARINEYDFEDIMGGFGELIDIEKVTVEKDKNVS